MYEYIKSSSFGKSTTFALCDALSITVKSGWKSTADYKDPWAEYRGSAIEVCKEKAHKLDVDCATVATDDFLGEAADCDTKYTYVALDLGPLHVFVKGKWYKTIQDMHFTIAYLPALTCACKWYMWRNLRETLYYWIRLNCNYTERPLTVMSFRRVRIFEEYDNNCWTICRLVNMDAATINKYLFEKRIELVTPTSRLDADGNKEFEPEEEAVVRMYHRDIGRLKQSIDIERRSHGKEQSRHTVQMSFQDGQSEGSGSSHIPPATKLKNVTRKERKINYIRILGFASKFKCM